MWRKRDALLEATVDGGTIAVVCTRLRNICYTVLIGGGLSRGLGLRRGLRAL